MGISTLTYGLGFAVSTLEELLFQFSLCDFDLDRLVDLLVMATFVIGIILNGSRKQSVDEGSFA